MDKESYLEALVLGRSSFDKRKKLKELDNSDDDEIIIPTSKHNFQLKPVWDDPDDQKDEEKKSKENYETGLKYNKKLKEKFSKSNITSNVWADINVEKKDSEDSEFRQTVDSYLTKNGAQDSLNSLDANLLKYKWVGNLRNFSTPSSCNKEVSSEDNDLDSIIDKDNPQTHSIFKGGRISSLKFHPNFRVLLSTDAYGTFRLFQIDDNNNNEIQKVELKKFSISSSDFISSGNEEIIFVASNAWFLYNFDLMSGRLSKIYWKKKHSSIVPKQLSKSYDGKYFVLYGNNSGQILLFSQNSKEHISTLYTNSNLCSVVFAADSSLLLAVTEDGEIYVWDLSFVTRSNYPTSPTGGSKGIYKFQDRGNYRATSMAFSPDARYLSTGSDSGVVNLYDTSSWLTKGRTEPPPLVRSWKNIPTPVTLLDVNPQSELLVMGSSYKKDCIKIANLSKRSIYTNFPNNKARLSFSQSVYVSAFSPSSGYLAVGSDYSNVNLYRYGSLLGH